LCPARRLLPSPKEGTLRSRKWRAAMPLFAVSAHPGRTAEQKGRFAAAATESARFALGAGEAHAIVALGNVPGDWHRAGRPPGAPPRADPLVIPGAPPAPAPPLHS